MDEFLSRPSEAILSEEVELAVALANDALPNPQPDVSGRVRKWENFGVGKHEQSLLFEKQTSEGANYLIGLKVIGIQDRQDVEATMYILTPEVNEFMTVHGDKELFTSLGASGDDEVAKDFQDLLFEMGDFHPQENDWKDFMNLIGEAGEQAKRQNEEMARLLGGAANDARHIPVTRIDEK